MTMIGLIGAKRSGKDTLARRLIARHGFTRYAFADPLKGVVLGIDPLVARGTRLRDLLASLAVEHDDPWEPAKEIPEVRRLLQDTGVSVRNRLGDDTWLDATMPRALRDPGPVVFTDVRFDNEADAVEAHGGILVRITRPGAGGDTHESETALADRKTLYVINNDGTIPDLRAKADRLIAGLRLRLR